ncbi:hypothetical protein BGW36DRAFT_428369 [Talaromyces proteolyticus]|uniref:Gag protein n=1 Tax=Talaromyces proteolyticus TaxID=1131652 RepID=A0AAD4KTP3_9EURO|nr:uncharacterized protein BGW36DRAFT_428369 [Talaromyces proteolyticus]KAH8696356.1 hypothetical protein BGW36DRAFT_428369 [Talaromyces proteolyticus]
MTSNLSSQVILTDSSKWDEWDTAFNTFVQGRAMEGYLDGTIKAPKRPHEPVINDYLEGQAREQRTQSQDTEEESQISSFQAKRDLNIQDLTAAKRKAYGEAVATYKLLFDTFLKQSREYQELVDWMRNTVRPEFARNALDTAREIPEKYANLEALAGGGKADVLRQLNSEYKHLTTPWKRIPKDIQKWIMEWEILMTKGNRHRLPQTQLPTIWANDFFNAVRLGYPVWVDSYRSVQEEAIDTGTLTYRALSRAFRRTVDVSDNPKGTAGRIGDNNNRKRKATGQKRKRDTEKRDSTRCKACGGIHSLRQCYYLFSNLAPESWIPRDFLKRRVEKNLRENNELGEEVKRIRIDKNSDEDHKDSN